jgi:hypothetical protein
MDIDFHKIAGDRTIFDYKNSSGFHVAGEWEVCINYRLSFIVGAQFHFVNYNIKSLSVNGIPLSPAQTIDEFKKIDGSGIDIYLGLLFHI